MRFLVLGPFEVRDGDRPVPIAGVKERMILADLIAHIDRAVPADDLIDALWGESPPRTAERTLRSYISRLRHALEPDRSSEVEPTILRSRGDGYELIADGHEVDAIHFEQLASEGRRLLEAGDAADADELLEAALGLWRGSAYQEYRYTRFGGSEGERLEELRRAASEDRVEARMAIGDAGSLVADLEGMVREEPLRERRWGLLMLALYRTGRQAEALQAFARARAVLVDELGIEPGPDLQRLQAAILAQDPTLDQEPSSRAGSVRTIDVCPYKGLARFDTEDAEFFFGREHMVAQAIGHLVEGRFLALVGASGSGKSSLLRAGLVHALRSGVLPGSDRWAYSVIRPARHPREQLERATSDVGGATRRLIAIDQFEELFTVCPDDTERAAYLDALSRTVREPEGTVTIVIAMRADFYARCAETRTFASLLESDQVLLGPMDGSELRSAIVRPAERAGLTVEDALVEALVEDTLDQPGALPLLQTTLLELWTRRHNRTISLDEYLRAGGVEGAVARLAEDAYARLDHVEQDAAKRILLRLASSGEGGGVVRRRAPLTEFDLDRDPTASRAIAILTEARLVTVADGTAEVAHEALLREWPRLRTWLEEDAEGRSLHRNLTASANAWDEGGRDDADLYGGARLAATLGWAAPHEAHLNALEQDFLRSSRRAAEGAAARTRQTNRRLRGLLAGVAALLAFSLVISGLALSQRNQARDALAVADAGRLALRSSVEQDPVLALVLAREAVHLDDSAETRSALFAALERSPSITGRIGSTVGTSPAGNESQWIALSPDGSTLAIGDAAPTVEFLDAVQRAPLGALDVGTGTERGTFSPDGRTLVVVTDDRSIVSIDVATRIEEDRVPASGPVDAIAFAPDGTSLLTAEAIDDETREALVRRDPTTLEPTAPGIPTDRGEGQVAPLASFAMAFTPDGRSLVTTHPGNGSSDGSTVVWSADLEPVRRTATKGNEIAISPNGREAVIVGNTGEGSSHTETRFTFLDVQTGTSRVRSIAHGGQASTQFETTGVAFTPDGRSVVTAGNDSRLIVWDAATATIRQRIGGTGDVPLRGPVISPDGATAFTTSPLRDVVIWDLSGRESLARPFTAGSGFPLWPYFAISPDGRLIAVPSVPGGQFERSGTLAVIDTSTLRVVQSIRYGDSSPMGYAFSPDSSMLAVATDGCRSWRPKSCQQSSLYSLYQVRVWDVASGRPVTPNLPGIEGTQVWALWFSPDGTKLAGGGIEREEDAVHLGRAYVWDLSDGGRLEGQVHTDQPINQLAFTPDGSLLAAVTGQSEGGDLITWDASSLARVLSVQIDNVGVYSSDISDDSSTIVTGGQTGGPRLWDLTTGRPLGPPLTGLNGFALTVDIAPNAETVAGADDSGDVQLWDVRTGTTIGDPLPGPEDQWVAALFSPDGRRLFVVSDTGSGWAWDVDPSDWTRRACQIAGRSLTQQEWATFLPDRPYHATCGP